MALKAEDIMVYGIGFGWNCKKFIVLTYVIKLGHCIFPLHQTEGNYKAP